MKKLLAILLLVTLAQAQETPETAVQSFFAALAQAKPEAANFLADPNQAQELKQALANPVGKLLYQGFKLESTKLLSGETLRVEVQLSTPDLATAINMTEAGSPGFSEQMNKALEGQLNSEQAQSVAETLQGALQKVPRLGRKQTLVMVHSGEAWQIQNFRP
jgi:hypothetical protein